MEITIKNCKNIDLAKIKIEEGKLNIKYALNGTGKSTIASALEFNTGQNQNPELLIPFKYRGTENEKKYPPTVEGAEAIKSIKVFNESYINRFAFKKDDLIQNSFEIFIKNDTYDDQMRLIENNLTEIKRAFEINHALAEIIRDLFDLSKCFGTPTKNTPYHGSSHIGKGLGKGNKLANIPKQLECFSDYLKSKVNVSWINWQIKGNEFVDISTSCPYCTSSTNEKKEIIKSVSKEFDSKSIEHINKLQEIFEKLKKYFSDEASLLFSELFNNSSAISKEGQAFLQRVKLSADTLYDKLSSLNGISFFSLKDVDKVAEKIKELKIDMRYLADLNSKETLKIVTEVNKTLDNVLAQTGNLQDEINKQKEQIQNTISEHKGDINSFLKNAGFHYQVEILFKNDRYTMHLKHREAHEGLTEATNFLSYGERNAFSIILFMYHCLKDKPDLIILDDPISSFDRNKKFALIENLFRKESSLKDKTVLMLTHDLEPIIDMIYVKRKIYRPNTIASFLGLQNGIIQETTISSKDILSFSKICEDVIASTEDEIIKLIHLRRLLEVSNEKQLGYELISNLMHKREIPIIKEGEKERNMNADEIANGSAEIKTYIPGFDYSLIIERIFNEQEMADLYKNTKSHQSKLQIFRIIKYNKIDNSTFAKFINETYHIENDYIMQLSPKKYEIIPQYIIEECDNALQHLDA
jgi:hypothetical protein